MTFENIKFEKRGHVALATLNSPKTLNAITPQMNEEIISLCGEVEADDDIRVLMFTGEGRGFCSGANVGGGPAPTENSQSTRLDDHGWVGRLALAIYDMTKPTVAAVNGVAAGAGMSLALGCDIRLGSEKARFKTVFIERSLSPDCGMSYYLPRIVGFSRAADLLFTSRKVEADEALRIGLLDHVFSQGDFIEKAVEYAGQIAFWPPVAMRSAKRVLQQNINVDFDTALRNEMYGLQFAKRAPNDVKEARLSFTEKRPPKFTGT